MKSDSVCDYCFVQQVNGCPYTEYIEMQEKLPMLTENHHRAGENSSIQPFQPDHPEPSSDMVLYQLYFTPPSRLNKASLNGHPEKAFS